MLIRIWYVIQFKIIPIKKTNMKQLRKGRFALKQHKITLWHMCDVSQRTHGFHRYQTQLLITCIHLGNINANYDVGYTIDTYKW